MRLRISQLGSALWQASFIAASLFCFSSLVTADELADHLAVGDFASARQLADQMPANRRDASLSRIALAQQRSGVLGGSLATAGAISSDRSRSSLLDGLRGEPLRGGAALADFDTLIELITTTVAADSWEEVGGAGAIQPFPGGVLVDTSGLLSRRAPAAAAEPLVDLRAAALKAAANRDVRQPSKLRKVSLNRLEKEIQLLWAEGKQPTQPMQLLAGIHEVKYLLLYPESGDIVLAGPAGAWQSDGEGRTVSADSGRPVLQLNDLVTLLRNSQENAGKFGCSINPRQQNLAAAKTFLAQSKPLRSAADRTRWLGQLRGHMGRQDIEVFGIDPQSRVAHVIVEADYRMKLVGMGLEPGVAGVTSYLDSVSVKAGSPPPPMSVLRWWFTLNYQAVEATADRQAFQWTGSGAQVLSENELLTKQGRRVHTGKADELTRQFAQSFTKHFPELEVRYPIYAELRNIFDLAIVAGLIRSHNLPAKTNWHLTHFGDPKKFQVPTAASPEEVESVIRHRVLDRKHILAGVSGGVSVDTAPLTSPKAVRPDRYGLLKGQRIEAQPKTNSSWWWD